MDQKTHHETSKEPVNPSVAFARGQALWVYNMAKPLGANLDNRSIDESASDAVRTALRQMHEEGLATEHIDIGEAVQALIGALADDLDISLLRKKD